MWMMSALLWWSGLLACNGTSVPARTSAKVAGCPGRGPKRKACSTSELELQRQLHRTRVQRCEAGFGDAEAGERERSDCQRSEDENDRAGFDYLPTRDVEAARKLADKEYRTMSKLMRAVFREYERMRRWDEINAYGRSRAGEMGITEADIPRIVKE